MSERTPIAPSGDLKDRSELTTERIRERVEARRKSLDSLRSRASFITSRALQENNEAYNKQTHQEFDQTQTEKTTSADSESDRKKEPFDSEVSKDSKTNISPKLKNPWLKGKDQQVDSKVSSKVLVPEKKEDAQNFQDTISLKEVPESEIVVQLRERSKAIEKENRAKKILVSPTVSPVVKPQKKFSFFDRFTPVFLSEEDVKQQEETAKVLQNTNLIESLFIKPFRYMISYAKRLTFAQRVKKVLSFLLVIALLLVAFYSAWIGYLWATSTWGFSPVLIQQQSLPRSDSFLTNVPESWIIDQSQNFIETSKDGDSAAAVMAFILRANDRYVEIDKTKEHLKTFGESDYVLPDVLADALNGQGFSAGFYHSSLDNLKAHIANNDHIICLLGNGAIWQRYVLLVGYDSEAWYLVDPAFPNAKDTVWNRIVTTEQFKALRHNGIPFMENTEIITPAKKHHDNEDA